MLGNVLTITDKISLIMQVYQLSFVVGNNVEGDRREDIPDSIGATLEKIDKDAYVNIYTILHILITIPISSASCERSISTLRNLKT